VTRALVIAALALAAAAPSRDVAIRLHWKNKDLPGAMQVYAPAAGAKTVLWKTGPVASRSEFSLGEEVTDRAIAVTRGQPKRLILAYENKGDTPLHFFAAPHHAEPEESSLGFKFKCLCVNHAFTVPPGRTWYRIVELRIDPDFSGDALDVTHTLIGIDEARAREFSKSPGME
jgi:hypothetical protein